MEHQWKCALALGEQVYRGAIRPGLTWKLTELRSSKAGLTADAAPFTVQHEQWMASDPDYVAEDMAMGITETVSRIMGLEGMSRAELAKRMGVSRAYVTHMLQAPPNMTLKTLAAVGLAIGAMPRVVFRIQDDYLEML